MSHIRIFMWVLFIPVIVFFLFEGLFESQTLYLLPLKSDADVFRYQQFIDSSVPEIGLTTLHILLNNLLVCCILWLIPLFVWFVFCRKKDIETLKKKYVLYVAIFCYSFFFLKEAIRVLSILFDFQSTTDIPYVISFVTLIMPHGIIEFGAFFLASYYGMNWYCQRVYSNNQFVFPKVLHIVLPFFILTIAAIIETTLTPFCFQKGLEYYLALSGG